MVQGNLREQLRLSAAGARGGRRRRQEALAQVNLDEVLARVDGDLGKEVDWTNVLSLGEQQRVSFARLLLKKPTIAFLDEATSAPRRAERAPPLRAPAARHRLRERRPPQHAGRAFHDHLLMLARRRLVELEPIEPDDEGRAGETAEEDGRAIRRDGCARGRTHRPGSPGRTADAHGHVRAPPLGGSVL
jgi:hypothetical protein